MSTADLDDKVKESLEVFCEEAATILASEDWAENMEAWACGCDVADLVDGRLLSACVQDASIGVNEIYRTLAQACGALGAGLPSDDNAASNGKAGKDLNIFLFIAPLTISQQRYRRHPNCKASNRTLSYPSLTRFLIRTLHPCSSQSIA